MISGSILWRGLFLSGHELCRLESSDVHRRLAGTALLVHDGAPCRLDYEVVCDTGWRTRSAIVSGRLGGRVVETAVTVDDDGRWRLGGVERPELAGCLDIDLNFSPSTNLLPIRRLGLAVGEKSEVRAAWLRFPSFELELLIQSYFRLGEFTYRYESGGGRFTADLQVDANGFVTDYPGIWQAEASA